MILYVDETENERFFIVTGLLVNSEADVLNAYKKFKHHVSAFKIAPKTKQNIFKEFKSYFIDRRYQKIKREILSSIVETEGAVLYSVHLKKNSRFNQALKEATYITLLSSIVGSIDSPVNIVFDGFRKPDFESNIVYAIGSSFSNVSSIVPGNSELVPGLQFADNACSAVRLHLSNEDEFGYYEIIKNILTEV